MSYHRHSNPFAALSITFLILGTLVAAGLYCGYSKYTEERGVLNAYFTEAATKQHFKPIRIKGSIPQPDMEISTASIICLNTIFADSIEATDDELTNETILPLAIETSIPPEPAPSAPPDKHKDIIKSSEPTYTPPICRTAPQPDYPAEMKSTRRHGEVRVRIHIGQDGTPTAVDIISTTHTAFAQAAHHCILKRWKFIPARENNQPVPSIANITIHFTP